MLVSRLNKRIAGLAASGFAAPRAQNKRVADMIPETVATLTSAGTIFGEFIEFVEFVELVEFVEFVEKVR